MNPNKLHKLNVMTNTGTLEFKDVIEYDWGFYYLFLRTLNNTVSIERENIIGVNRRYNNKWIKVKAKKIKKQRKK